MKTFLDFYQFSIFGRSEVNAQNSAALIYFSAKQIPNNQIGTLMSSLLLRIRIFYCFFYRSDDAGPKTAVSMMLNLSQDLRGPHQLGDFKFPVTTF